MPERSAAGNPIRPDEIAVNARIMPIVEAAHDEVTGIQSSHLMVFGEDLAAGTGVKVGLDAQGVVVNQLAPKAYPVFHAVFLA